VVGKKQGEGDQGRDRLRRELGKGGEGEGGPGGRRRLSGEGGSGCGIRLRQGHGRSLLGPSGLRVRFYFLFLFFYFLLYIQNIFLNNPKIHNNYTKIIYK
jgi:hypothetical protein